MFAAGGEDQISWACHIGGISPAPSWCFVLQRRDVPIFDREVVTPRAVEVEQTERRAPGRRRSRRRAGAASS